MFDEDYDDNGNLLHREALWQIETIGEGGYIAVWGRITSVAQIEILWEGAQRGESKKAGQTDMGIVKIHFCEFMHLPPIRVLCIHFHHDVAKAWYNHKGKMSYDKVFDILAQACIVHEVEFLIGDWNQALARVTEEMQSRNVVAFLRSYRLWPDGTFDCLGIFSCKYPTLGQSVAPQFHPAGKDAYMGLYCGWAETHCPIFFQWVAGSKRIRSDTRTIARFQDWQNTTAERAGDPLPHDRTTAEKKRKENLASKDAAWQAKANIATEVWNQQKEKWVKKQSSSTSSKASSAVVDASYQSHRCIQPQVVPPPPWHKKDAGARQVLPTQPPEQRAFSNSGNAAASSSSTILRSPFDLDQAVPKPPPPTPPISLVGYNVHDTVYDQMKELLDNTHMEIVQYRTALDCLYYANYHPASGAMVIDWQRIGSAKDLELLVRTLRQYPPWNRASEWRIPGTDPALWTKLHGLLHNNGIKNHASVEHEGERCLAFHIRSPTDKGQAVPKPSPPTPPARHVENTHDKVYDQMRKVLGDIAILDCLYYATYHPETSSMVIDWHHIGSAKDLGLLVRTLRQCSMSEPSAAGAFVRDWRIPGTDPALRAKLHRVLHNNGINNHESVDHEGERCLAFQIPA